MIEIYYSSDGVPISDFEAPDKYREILIAYGQDQEIILSTSTALIINLIRLGIVRDEIDHRHVRLHFMGQWYEFDQFGKTPALYDSIYTRTNEEILLAMLDKVTELQ